MEDQELYILIQKYISNDMNASEKSAFEIRMSTDEALKSEVELYLRLEKGVKKFAKHEMKTDLAKAYTAVNKTNAFKKYKPSLNAGGGFNLMSFLAKVFVLSSIASLVLVYINKMPIKNEYIDSLHEKLHSIDTLFEVKYDTVWTTIQNSNVKVGDTVFIKNKKELNEFNKLLQKESEDEFE